VELYEVARAGCENRAGEALGAGARGGTATSPRGKVSARAVSDCSRVATGVPQRLQNLTSVLICDPQWRQNMALFLARLIGLGC
jgi:hypothetical protein